MKEKLNYISWYRKFLFHIQADYNSFIKIPLKDIQTTKKLFTPSSYRFFFLITALSFLLLLPFLSKDAGISGDEEKHHLQAAKVCNYYSTMGKDRSALFNINSSDPMQFNGQSFDVITYFFEKKFKVDNIYEMRHFFNALVGWLIILFAGLITKELIGWGGGIATMVLLFITPTFLGHSYNNNKDIPFALGFIMSIYYVIIYFRQFPKPTFKSIFLVSFSIAIAISVRAAGVLIIGYIVIYAILFIIKENYLAIYKIKYLKTLIIQLSGIIILGYFIGILIWPFALQHPISNMYTVLQVIKYFPISLAQIFEGNMIWSDQIPWYYISKYILITIPIVIISGLAFFILLPFRIVNKTNWLEIFFIAFSFIFPLIFSSINNNNDYGGWRHVLFIYPSMVICSTIGFYVLLGLFKNKFIRYILLFIIIIYSTKSVLHIIRNHPLEYIYYNEFVGGVNNAYANYEMDYFQNSLRSASEWLTKYIKEQGIENHHKIIIASNGSISYYFRHDTATLSTFYCNYNNRRMNDWDYMIACNTYIVPYQLRNNYFPPANTIYQVKVDDAPVCIIIERKQKYDYQAYEFLKSNQSKALDLLKKALSIEPRNIDILLELTQCHAENNNYPVAQQVVEYILSIDPNNQDALNANGIIYMNTNRVPEAIKLFHYIIQNINPNYPSAYYNLGSCFLLNKDYDKALACYKKCIEINRGNKNAYLKIAHILMVLNKTEEAKKFTTLGNSILN